MTGAGSEGGGDDDVDPVGGDVELTDLDGIGPARAEKLRDAGFESVADLREARYADIAEVLPSDLAERVKAQLDESGSGEDSDPPAETGGASSEASATGGPTVPPSTDGSVSGSAGNSDGAEGGPTVPPSTDGSVSDSAGNSDGTEGSPTVPPGSGDRQSDDEDVSAVVATSEPTADANDGRSASAAAGEEPTGGGAARSSDTVRTATVEQSGEPVSHESSNADSLLAGILSCFIVPGLGNVYTGDTERGAIMFVFYVVWVILGWGVGLFFIGSMVSLLFAGITFLLAGIGGLVWFVFAAIVVAMELIVRLIAGYDAYRQSELVDTMTVRVNEARSN